MALCYLNKWTEEHWGDNVQLMDSGDEHSDPPQHLLPPGAAMISTGGSLGSVLSLHKMRPPFCNSVTPFATNVSLGLISSAEAATGIVMQTRTLPLSFGRAMGTPSLSLSLPLQRSPRTDDTRIYKE